MTDEERAQLVLRVLFSVAPDLEGETIEPDTATGLVAPTRKERPREASEFGISVDGQPNVALRLAKCCRTP